MPKPPQKVPAAPEPAPANPWVLRGGMIFLLLTAVTISWGGKTAGYDTYMALAGGRDVQTDFHSLTGPDTWSFMSEGRTWINQSWFAHLIFYQLFLHAGGLGLVILKWLLILGIATLIVSTAILWKTEGWVAVLFVSAMLLAS